MPLIVFVCLCLTACTQIASTTKPDRATAARSLTAQEASMDTQLAADFAYRLEAADERFKQASYDLLVFHGTLLLVGRVFDTQMQEMAKNVAHAEDAARFFDYTRIGAPLGVIAKTNNVSKRTRFISSLIAYSGVDAAIVHSLVFEDVLYLMGFVTKQQASAIIDIATQIDGISRVRVLFEYVDYEGNLLVLNDAA